MRRPNVSGKTVRTVSTSPFRISCSSCLSARRPGMTRIVAHGSRLCHPPGARRTRPVNNRREQIGWYFYDWANSAFPTTVVAVFLAPWLTTETKAAADAGGFGYPLGNKGPTGAFFPYGVFVCVLRQGLLLPRLGAD